MKITLQNAFLKAVIHSKGAELESLSDDKQNYIWMIDEQFWNKTSPILFPIVGRLKNDEYQLLGNTYSLPRHGFARDFDFEVVQQTENSVCFSLKNNEKTLENYPFEFELQVIYTLIDKKLDISYGIKNQSNTQMPFSIGAHPAFAIYDSFEAYSIEFEKDEDLVAYSLENEQLSGETKTIKLNNKQLVLDYNLFEKDAIVLKDNATSYVKILKNGVPQYQVTFPDFPYLGIWTKIDAPFICIEPWLGIADHANHSGNIMEKEGIQILDPQAEKTIHFEIEILK